MAHNERFKTIPNQWSAAAIAAVALLVFSFLLGGASRSHALRLLLVELAALPLLVFAVQEMAKRRAWGEHVFTCSLAGLLLALPLLQLVPLPPALWTALPGRQELSLAQDLAEVLPGWSPMTLTPDLTWRAWLSLTPPLAMFLGMLALGRERPDRLVWIYLIAGSASVVLCSFQIATADPRLYAWSWTDPGSVVGLFANRNHMAAFFTSSLPFAAALAVSAANSRGGGRLIVWLGLAYVGLMVVAIAATQSRAGFVFGIVSLLAAAGAAWVGLDGRQPNARVAALAGVVTVTVLVVGLWGLGPVLARFNTLNVFEGRIENWPLIIDAAQTYLPAGSGIGSFDAVFRSVEPLDTLDPTYFNEAHNEFLQVWLEAGWFGAGLLIAFLVWFARRSSDAWRGGGGLDRNLQRAASIAIALILAHSFADYPLRTETMMVFFALCCGILEFAAPPHRERAQPA